MLVIFPSFKYLPFFCCWSRVEEGRDGSRNYGGIVNHVGAKDSRKTFSNRKDPDLANVFVNPLLGVGIIFASQFLKIWVCQIGSFIRSFGAHYIPLTDIISLAALLLPDRLAEAINTAALKIILSVIIVVIIVVSQSAVHARHHGTGDSGNGTASCGTVATTKREESDGRRRIAFWNLEDE